MLAKSGDLVVRCRRRGTPWRAVSAALFAVLAVAHAMAQSPTAEEPLASPPRPDDPRAAKTYAVLETHCARCHQAGRTEQPLASGSLANILAINDIARNAVLVRPGLPDASRLYDVLVTRHAPLEVYGSDPNAPEPSPDEITYVRDWIKDLPASVQACPSRKQVKGADADALMREAQRAEREQAGDVRFFSLIHLYNSCATAAEMAGYRQALTKLVNSLSWAAEPIKLTALDPTGALLSLKLSDIGWTAERWAEVTSRYPATLAHKINTEVTAAAGTDLPVVNGDWFADAASAPPLYSALLGLPTKLSELARMNGVDLDKSIRRSAARRILVRSSRVARANRMIERHPGSRGGFWMVYDFTTSSGEQDLIEFPLGPKSATGARAAFKPDEVRVIFPLPNGFLAYALFNAAGDRIDRVLPGIEKPYAGVEIANPEPTTESAIACFSCHTTGIIAARDEFRPFVDSLTGVTPSDARSAAMPLFASDSENALLIGGDVDRYGRALAAAGIDPTLRIRGQEAITALARRYLEDADFEAALSEAGLERDVFLAELASSGGAAAPLARRLLHGVLPRSDLDRLFALLKGDTAPSALGSSGGGFLSEPKSEIGLSLWVDKPRPSPGDLVTVQAEVDSTCYLTVISVDAQGRAMVLFPNDFEPDNRIAPGEQKSIPGPDSPYQLRFKGDGLETLIARCSASAKPPAGIEHDFVRQRFTVLGNWENFIFDTLVTDAELRLSPEKAARARFAQAGAQRQRQARGEALDQRPDIVQSRPLRDGRAVVVLGDR